jgi:hypothetical protein
MGTSCQTFEKFSRRSRKTVGHESGVVGTVTGFPWILDFWMFFPDLDFRIRFTSLGRSGFRRIWIKFYGLGFLSDRIGSGRFTQRIGSTRFAGQVWVFSDRIGPGSVFKGFEKN